MNENYYIRSYSYSYYTYSVSSYVAIWPVADLGGLGGCSPPPANSGHTLRAWMCTVVIHVKTH